MSRIKDTERILKTAGEKQLVIFKGNPIRLSDDFSGETLLIKEILHGISIL